MVHGLDQRHAHQAGGGDGAIEPRQLHHLQNVADASAFLTDAPGKSLGELDFARSIGTVAELVFQALQANRIARAVRPKARHQKAGEPARRLRQNKKRIAHRGRHEPLVTDDRIAFRRRGSRRGIGAHVGAALFLGHAHAERHSRFFPPRAKLPVVGAGDEFGRDAGRKLGRGGKRRQPCPRHGDRTQMPSLHLRRHIEACRAQNFGRRRRARAGSGPGRGVQSGANALGHQAVIGGMKFDCVAAKAVGVEGVELRRIFIGLAAERQHLGTTPKPAEIRQRSRFGRGAVDVDGLHKRQVGRK